MATTKTRSYSLLHMRLQTLFATLLFLLPTGSFAQYQVESAIAGVQAPSAPSDPPTSGGAPSHIANFRQGGSPGPGTPQSQAARNNGDPCSVHGFFHQTVADAGVFGHGLLQVPRNAIRPSNLAWELPILGTTGVLIAKVDRPAANRIQSKSLQQTANLWSNVGLGLEIGSSTVAYGVGCAEHQPHLRDAGFTALFAMGAAGTVDLALKLAFDRQFPTTGTGAGKFWGGGRSFPSGHAATSFAFAAVVAHRYPKNRWVKWGAYGLASGVSLARYPAKKHFPSDILMGATLGYVSGAYLAAH